jgi:monoamine oxidase
VYCAKKVVLSVSLGVLKKQKIKFTPQLPVAHTEAIAQLGFGSFNKVFVEFDESLNLQQHSDANSFFYYVNAQWLNILDLSKIYHKPMYLMLFGGQASEFVDTATDREIWQYLYQNLKLCLPNLPDKTVNMIVTRWGADELSLGSFSFPATGYIEQWVNTLNQSVEDRIFLAGEHCSLQYAGTVHGAYLSGVDRANVLLAQL